MDLKEKVLGLKPNKISTNMTGYNFLLYSEAGMGKTTFAVEMFPERHLIVGAEYGFKGIAGAVGYPVADYATLLNIVDVLDTEEAREVYDTLIIDTTTKIGEMIENYILSMYGKNSLGDCKSHGGAYPLINRYYNLAFDRLKARGYNFVYICHAKVEILKDTDGNEVGRKYSPKMSDRLGQLITPEVDYTFFLTQDKQGERIIVTDNNPKSVGKQRTPLPLTMPLDIESFRAEYKKGVKAKGGKMITDEKVDTTVVQSRLKVRDYKEIIAEIKDIGKKLVDDGKQTEAMATLNNTLGKDDNGVQRTLDMCTQENAEMLEVMLTSLKKLNK